MPLSSRCGAGGKSSITMRKTTHSKLKYLGATLSHGVIIYLPWSETSRMLTLSDIFRFWRPDINLPMTLSTFCKAVSSWKNSVQMFFYVATESTCMHTPTHTHMHKCFCTHTCMHTHRHKNRHLHTCTCSRTWKHMHTHVYIYINAHTHTHTATHLYAYANTHTHAHANILFSTEVVSYC